MQKKTQRERAPGILTETHSTGAARGTEIEKEIVKETVKETVGTVPTEVTENGTEVTETESGIEETEIGTETSEGQTPSQTAGHQEKEILYMCMEQE